MIEDIKKNKSRVWKKFAIRHKKMIGLWIILGILFVVGAVYVFLDFAEDAVESGLVPSLLGEWSVGHIFSFTIYLVFWEVLIIGIPALITVIAIYKLWWMCLPARERKYYEKAELFNSSDKSKGSGFFSLIFYVILMIKVYIDGNWDLAISQWKFDYLIDNILWIFLVLAVIIGIPMTLGTIWYFSTLGKKETAPNNEDRQRPKPFR